MMTLDKLELMKSAKIINIDANEIKNRLLDLGMVEGADIRALYESPTGNPRAYYIRDTLIALRKSEASLISVKPLS